MTNKTDFTLTNPNNGNLSFRIFHFEGNSHFDRVQRNNYYSLLWITKGNGKLKADFSAYDFEPNTLFAFAPYQPFALQPGNIEGVAINFHHDFFCIHRHQSEVSCNGVLFNNIYEPPFVSMEKNAETINMLVGQINAEVQNVALAQYDLLISYMKILLITASRAKTEQNPAAKKAAEEHKEPLILQNLKNAIEKDFKIKHSPSQYADDLNISAKALGKIAKTHFNKTLGDLISERIIIEAKRELYVTTKSIKEIAYELGYQDEYYFSRFFKANTDVSPQHYRTVVGFENGMQLT